MAQERITCKIQNEGFDIWIVQEVNYSEEDDWDEPDLEADDDKKRIEVFSKGETLTASDIPALRELAKEKGINLGRAIEAAPVEYAEFFVFFEWMGVLVGEGHRGTYVEEKFNIDVNDCIPKVRDEKLVFYAVKIHGPHQTDLLLNELFLKDMKLKSQVIKSV